MQDLNLQLFNDQIKSIDELERQFLDAFADFNQEFLWKFEGISLICLKLERAKAIAIVKSIWSQYSFMFYKTLTSGTKRESISVLYALIQMGNLSAVIANDLIQNFNFNLKLKTSWTISRKKCTQMHFPYEEYIKEYDTRSLFILFVCTLLRKSEVQARQKFVSQAKAVIAQIFPGLEKDTDYIQQMFLETLKKYVIDPDSIPKNSKIAILQVKHLEKIAFLNKSFSIEFLRHVCTRPGHGICYQDMGWYPPDKEKVNIYNKILSDFIPGLKVLKIEGHKELLLEILRNCSELVKGYVSKLHLLPIDQFLHQDWEDSLKVLADIVNLPIPENFGALMKLPPPVSHIIDSIVPSCFTSNISTKGLQHSKSSVKAKISEFLCLTLQKLDRVVKKLLAISDDFGGKEWSDCAEELLVQVQKRIPTWQLIVSFHHSCISDEMENHLELKRSAYKLVSFYQKFFIRSIQESHFNYGKLILGNMHTLPSDIQYLFLEIMGNVKDFKWWVASDNGGSHFRKLLNYYVSCRNRELKDVALVSLVACMSKGALFSENSDYLYILLHSLQATSKFHQNSVISFLDKSICEAEKSCARTSSIKASFDDLKIPSTNGYYGSYFCLYWLIESFKRIMNLKETNVEHIVIFFSRIILEQLYSMEEAGDNLLYIGSILRAAISQFHSENFSNLLIHALNIVEISSEGGGEISHSIFTVDQKYISGKIKRLAGVKEVNVSDLANEYSPQEISYIASQNDLVLSPEVIHEIVSTLSIYHPALIYPENHKLNPAIIHSFPLSYILEYCVHISDISHILSIIKDCLDIQALRFIFIHAILYLKRSSNNADTQRLKLCDCVLISIIERSIKLNCIEEILSCKPFQKLFLSAFQDAMYSKLLAKDILTVSIFRIVSKILRIQNDNVQNSLTSGLWAIKEIFVKNIGNSFPTIADVEILNVFKYARKTKIRVELLDAIYSKLDFERFCGILDTIFLEYDAGGISGRYFSVIVQKCTVTRSETSFALMEKILSLSRGDLASEQNLIYLNRYNAFGTNLMILEEDSAEVFIPVLAANVSLRLEHTIRYFIRYYPRFWKLFLSTVSVENLNVDEIILLQECFMRACCTKDSSYTWKAFIEDEVKSELGRLWQYIKESVTNELKGFLFGRNDYDHRISFIFQACSSLFGSSPSLLQEILIGIPTMSCNRDTLTILLDVLPLLKIMADSVNKKRMILTIILRIFRGYLIFMKDKEELLDIQDIVNELVSLSNDTIMSGDNGDDKEIMKYMSNFFVTVLKSYFENHILVSSITSLWQASFRSEFNLLSGERLLDMIITHSKFNDVMTSHDIKYGNTQFQLARMIKIIMETSPAQFCTVQYLEKIVPFYNGTVKASDRVLLSIFALYETRLGISALSWIQRDWTNKGNGDILSSLDISKMIQTLTDFPTDKQTEDILDAEYTVTCFDESDYYLYDISFLIPFAASLLLDPGNTLDLSLFIKSNLLGIVTMGLSSTSEQTRRASSSLLVKFDELLNSSDLKERIFINLLFDALKNAITCDTDIPPRIPSIITYFVAQSSLALINSESLMYPLINRFLLQRPVLDLKDIPMFYERIYSSSEFNRYERIWLLKILSCGMMNDNDYHILKRRHAIDILFGFYNSSICDSQMKLMILEILYKSSKKLGIAKSVMMRSSILTFFHSVCLKADFAALEECTLCIPSVLASFSKMCLQLESKSNYYSSCRSSINTTISFYLRLLIDAFPNIKNNRLGYGALSHILNLISELFYSSKHISILGTRDIMNIISIVDSYEAGNDNVLSKKVITPSRIHIDELLPTEYSCTKEALKCVTAKWIFSMTSTTLENPYFTDILAWVSNIVVCNEALYEGFGMWVISCRLNDQKNSFKSNLKSEGWGVFMKNLFIICGTTDKVCMSIYSTLLVLIMRDLDYGDLKLLEIVPQIPAPRKILLKTFEVDNPDIELIFYQLRKVLWTPLTMICKD